MPEDQWPEPADIIDVGLPLEIRDRRALALTDKDRLAADGAVRPNGRTDPTWHQLPGLLEGPASGSDSDRWYRLESAGHDRGSVAAAELGNSACRSGPGKLH